MPTRPPKTPPAEAAPEEPTTEQARWAFIQAEAERAVAPYVGLLPPEVVRAFRDRAAAYLAADPQMVRLLDVAFPQAARDASAMRAVPGVETGADDLVQAAEKKA